MTEPNSADVVKLVLHFLMCALDSAEAGDGGACENYTDSARLTADLIGLDLDDLYRAGEG